MGLFPKFGSWINLNTQQNPPQVKEESENSENVKSNSVSKKDTNNNAHAKKKAYYDKEVEKKQYDIWHEAEKKHPWHDAPPKVKVTTKNGICHMNIEFTVGMSPAGVYYQMTNPDSSSSPFTNMEKWIDYMKPKSRKVLMEDGPRRIVKSEKIVSRDFLRWSIPITVTLIDEENIKDFTTKYKKEKLMFMKVFEGNYKVEPIYVDSERLCKHKMPKCQEEYLKCSKEYLKCSNGQGKIASKVIMEQRFQPYPLFNLLPPLSWYIRGITIETTKTMLKGLQSTSKTFREAGPLVD